MRIRIRIQSNYPNPKKQTDSDSKTEIIEQFFNILFFRQSYTKVVMLFNIEKIMIKYSGERNKGRFFLLIRNRIQFFPSLESDPVNLNPDLRLEPAAPIIPLRFLTR